MRLPRTDAALHARLADAAPTAEESARHLALATAEPDAETASVLEDAARAAQARGAPAPAAELAEQALRLTPQADVADARRRVFLAAEGHHVAGDGDRAIALLTNARADAAPGVDRATVLVELAAAHTDPHEAEALYNDAQRPRGTTPSRPPRTSDSQR